MNPQPHEPRFLYDNIYVHKKQSYTHYSHTLQILSVRESDVYVYVHKFYTFVNYFECKYTNFCSIIYIFETQFENMANENNNTRSYNSSKKGPELGKVPEKLIKEQLKLPPQAVETERGLLGVLLTHEHSFDEVCQQLIPEVFYLKIHQYIYEAISELSLAQKSIDSITVAEQLKKNGKFEEVGGYEYLAELADIGTSAVSLEQYADIIYDKFLARDLIRIASSIETQAFNDGTEIKNLMEYAEGQMFELNQRRVKKEVTKVKDVLNEVVDRIRAAKQNDGGFTGLRTSFDKLDEYTNGWQPSTLNIIAARPAMGKTAFVLSMAKNMAIDHNSPVAIFSLEMSNQELVQRLVINVSEIPGEKIKRGDLSNAEWKQLQTRIECLESAPIYIDDTANMSISELCSKARRLSSERGIKCIIIDYLQLMNASGMSYGSREQEVSIISRSLKGLAKELNIPVIALSQLNRGVEQRSRDDKTPQLSDLRESGAIEQDADMVVFIHRPEYYGITTDKDGNSNEGVAEIIIAKHRSGSVGTVRLRFTKELIKFSNIDFSANHNNMDFGSRKNNAIEQYQSTPETYASSNMPQADSGDPF